MKIIEEATMKKVKILPVWLALKLARVPSDYLVSTLNLAETDV